MLETVSNHLEHARWIAVDNAPCNRKGAVFAYFRLSFTLEEAITVPVQISAADRYRLYVNGDPIHSGPAKGDHWNHFYDSLILNLVAGKNTLVARVVTYPPQERTVDRKAINGPTSVMSFINEPLFLLEGFAGNMDLSTGFALWQAAVDEATSLIPAPTAWQGGGAEQYDGALACLNWASEGGTSWPAAEIRFTSGINPYGEMSPLLLKERPIPSLYERPLTPAAQQPSRNQEERLIFENNIATVPAGHKQVLELAFDVLYTAFVRLNTLSGSGKIRLIYSEAYAIDAHTKTVRDDPACGTIQGITDVILPSGTPLSFDTFWFRTIRFMRIEVEAMTDLILTFPTFIETDYPLPVSTKPQNVPDWAAQIWDISLRTLNRCMHETYEDCPYYEQLQYTMDTRLEMLFTYIVGGDTRMARHTLWNYNCSQLPDGMLQSRYPSAYPQVIPVFSLHWVFMLEEYYIQTGDTKLLRQYRANMDAVLDYFDRRIGSSGLVESLGYWDFGDWTPQWNARHGVPFAVDHGPCTMHNLCYVQALQAAARLAEPMGRPSLAEDYASRAQIILSLIQSKCYDSQRQLFRESPDFSEYTQHSQVLAIRTGLVTGKAATELMERTLNDQSLIPCSFPWMFNLIRAMETAGLYERVYEVVWSQYQLMLDYHLTTVAECPFNTRSDCHAWSALILHELPRKWLGVQPGKPGWEEILIEPIPCSLSECSGTVYTPHGNVQVEWTLVNGAYQLSFDAPAVPVRVNLPDGRIFCFADGGSHKII